MSKKLIPTPKTSPIILRTVFPHKRRIGTVSFRGEGSSGAVSGDNGSFRLIVVQPGWDHCGDEPQSQATVQREAAVRVVYFVSPVQKTPRGAFR